MTKYRFIDDVEEATQLGLAGPRQRKAHIHTLSGHPLLGVTSVKGIIGSKDNLMQWYADMAAVAGLALPSQDIKAEYEAAKAIKDQKERQKATQALDKKYPDYAKARRAAIEHRDEAASTGSIRHGVLEDYIRECLQENEGKPINNTYADIQMFVSWAVKNVEQFYFTEAHCFSEKLWVGGIADLGLKMKDGKRLVGDHKNSKESYEDQFLQCAFYDVLLAENGGLTKNGQKLFDWEPADGMVIFPFRSVPFTPEFRFNMQRWHHAVDSTLDLYKLIELGV